MGIVGGPHVSCIACSLRLDFSKAPAPKSVQPEKSHLHTELRRALGNTTRKWKGLKQVQIWAVAGDLLIWEEDNAGCLADQQVPTKPSLLQPRPAWGHRRQKLLGKETADTSKES